MARPTLTSHRKFRRLSRALGSALIARGALELLWDHCYEAGDAYLGTADDLEQLVDWDGERGALVRALVEAGAPEGPGFIEEAGCGYRVHDLWHHAPDYVSNRRTRESERRVEKVCARCERTYHAADPRSRYCSAACRQGGWRDRVGPLQTVTERNGQSQSVTLRETDHNGTRAPAPAPAPAPAHQTPAATRGHRGHAYCGLRFCVPTFLHERFSNQLGEDGLRQFDLLRWYPLLDERDNSAIPGDVLAWVGQAFATETKRTIKAERPGTWTCPHSPPCGKTAWQCNQDAVLAEARRQREAPR